ncbi:MAG: outer membrane beta-barrel protein [Steroidobacteraceae bacterium]
MRKSLFLGLLALSIAGPAMAEDGFDYSYVELGYVKSELDDFDVDGDGFGLRGSYEFTQNIHAFAAYSDQEFDFDVNATTLELGAGYAWPVNSDMDLIGTVSYLQAEIDVPGFGSVDDDGLGLGVGVRARVVEVVELTGGVQYVNFDDAGSDTSLTAGARYFFTNMFAAGIDLAFDDDGTTWMLGGRFSFGQ